MYLLSVCSGINLSTLCVPLIYGGVVPLQECIDAIWNWAFDFMGVHLSNCPVGIHFQGNAAGSIVLQVRGVI